MEHLEFVTINEVQNVVENLRSEAQRAKERAGNAAEVEVLTFSLGRESGLKSAIESLLSLITES